MKIYTENTVLISEVIKHLYTVVGHDLRDCKKVELELRANVGVYKNLLDDIWDEIYGQLDSEAMITSTCKRWYTEKNIADGMCEYRIRLFDKESSC